MSLFLPDGAEELWLQLVTHKTANADLVLHLYVNNHTPADADTAGSYTEMSTQGYASKTLTGASWTASAGNPSSIVYAEQVWTADGTGGSTNVYGIYYTGPGSALLGVEVFPGGPFVVSVSGQQVGYTPTLTQRYE
jgi:hypothetical protein